MNKQKWKTIEEEQPKLNELILVDLVSSIDTMGFQTAVLKRIGLERMAYIRRREKYVGVGDFECYEDEIIKWCYLKDLDEVKE